jgi:hypothetical protein
MPSACGNVSSPPLTRAIRRMIVTGEESSSVVARRPLNTPTKRLVVKRHAGTGRSSARIATDGL